jgi:hypothetical protein
LHFAMIHRNFTFSLGSMIRLCSSEALHLLEFFLSVCPRYIDCTVCGEGGIAIDMQVMEWIDQEGV